MAKGLAASVSIAAGYLPIAFSFGVAAVQAGLSPLAAMATSTLVYAGASQFLLISLLVSGAGLLTTLATVLLMNARHMLYGPALITQQLHPTSMGTPWLAFGLTDEVFATAMSKMPAVASADREHWFVGLQLGAYATWLAGSFIGVKLVGEVEHWPAAIRQGLSFVLPALFMALLLETGLRRWWCPMGIAAVTAAALSLFIPSHHALALAIVAGATGYALWHRQE